MFSRSKPGIDIFGDVDDETVPDDLSANRRTVQPELVVERQYATLEGSLKLDRDVTIADGTVVHSFLFRHAPAESAGAREFRIEFDDPILGVAAAEATLEASDFLGFADPEFGPVRGAPGDSWEILDDNRAITIKVQEESDGLIELRILTRSSLQRR